MNEVRFFFFPHLLIPPAVCRNISIFLPCINILKIISEPKCPGCPTGHLEKWPANIDDAASRDVLLLLKEYRKMVEIYGGEGALTMVAQHLDQDIAEESRFRIRSRLKGVAQNRPADSYLLRLEAAVFLELALDLDEKELELNANLSHIKGLESEFREILGVEEDEMETEFILRTDNIPPDWGHLSYHLPKRIGFWWRLFPENRLLDSQPIFVTMSKEVVITLLDPVQTRRERDGRNWQPDQIELINLLSLEALNDDQIAELRKHLTDSGVLSDYYEALKEIPGDSEPHDFRRISWELGKAIEGFCNRNKWQLSAPFKMILTRMSDVSLGDLWGLLDRDGFNTLSNRWWEDTKAYFIHLE